MTRERRQKRKELFALMNQLDGKTIAECKKLICGKKLGSGAFRTVYECKVDKEYWVVKIERRDDGMFANATEWRNYMQYCETPIGKWLCPIECIDSTGRILVMRRVTFKKRFVDYPKKMPHVFNDFKIENYGFIDGKVVCVDYSWLMVDQSGKANKRVKWWKAS